MSGANNQSYKNAGVDVEAGYQAVELMKTHVAKTFTSAVLNGLGGFGGLYELDLDGITKPVLVSGTDGVGTKLKLAFALDRHDTIGIDCVAMCVNDVLAAGAKPLFFLDYIACGKNYPEKIAQIVSGVAEGCLQAGASLIGGETAEMPGFYPEHEYDLAGFCVGVVDKPKILDKNNVKVGDVLIALPSSGVHSNGFSLVRKIFGETHEELSLYSEELGCTVGEALLTPTKIYVKPVLEVLKQVDVHAVAHITGGGFYENLPRILPEGTAVKIEVSTLPVLPIFEVIKKKSGLSREELFSVFNMGVGMVLVVDRQEADRALDTLTAMGEQVVVIGEVTAGSGEVTLW